MLDAVDVTDFQRHKHFRIRVGPGLTTLVGPSDAGKSAVVRALRWAAFNVPAGAGFVRHGAPGAKVALRVDGRWVVRSRDKSENVYELDGEVFVAQKGSEFPPPAVAAVLNVGPANFQNQHDPVFWLADTPGQAARALNAVIDLGEIDAVLDAAAAECRRAKAELEITESRLADAETRLAETGWVDQFEADLAAVEKTHQTLLETTDRKTALGSALAEIDALSHAWDESRAAAGVGTRAVELGTELTTVARRRADLEAILDAGKRLARAAAADPTADFARVAGIRAAGDAAAERRRGLEHLLADVAAAEDDRCRAQTDLTAAETDLAEIELCPACGQPVGTSPPSFPTCTFPPGAPSPGPKPGTNGSPF